MKLAKSSLVALLLCVALCFSVFALAETDSARPVAENLEISTYRGVSVGGRLSAVSSVEGELKYEIVTPPAKGEIELGEDGCFVYTPKENRRGKDYFGYKAIDSAGNESQEATVVIRLLKQKSKITYSDMSGSALEYAATALAENGIFTGEQLAGRYVFSPEETVSRESFLAMCMHLTGEDLLTGVQRTGFADDQEIAVWAKPYVSTALRSGIISGYSSGETGAVFRGDQPISVAEAAVMLDRALDLTDVSSAWYAEEEAVPVWAMQSAANLSACGMMPVSGASELLTRGEAAEMLVSAMEVLNRR